MLFFLLKSQDKVETLEPEALVMFISRTYFFSHSWNYFDLCDPWNYILIWFIRFQLISLYTCLLRFIINANVFNFYFIFIQVLFFYFYHVIWHTGTHCSTVIYLHTLDNLWTCCSPPFIRNSIKKEEIGILITSNYKYCIRKKKESHKILNK